MADPLSSARLKLARAELHARTAKREARRFFNSQPNPTFRVEPESDTGSVGIGENLRIGDIFRCRLVVDRGMDDLPDSFSPRFGDAIQNFRHALDHLAWQLVAHGSIPSPTDDWAVQFPIYDTAGRFDNNIERRLPGVDQTVTGFIKARHRYVGGNATNDPLLSLARLSNDDKHRTLHVVASLFSTLENEVNFIRCLPISYENPPERPAAKSGAVVAIIEALITGEPAQLNMNIAPTIQIILEDGREFSDLLDQIGNEVREILGAPEILAAV